MRIEDEIQQNGFQDDYHRLVANLLFTNNWINQQLMPFFRRYGLTLQQHNVLSILQTEHPAPVCFGAIQCRMADRNSNVTRLVDKLLEKQFVTRAVCQTNRRMIEVRLTEKGLDKLQQLAAHLPELYQRFHGITRQEAALVSEILDKMRG